MKPNVSNFKVKTIYRRHKTSTSALKYNVKAFTTSPADPVPLTNNM